MSKVTVTSSFSLSGDPTTTLHRLMGAPADGSSDLASLSKNNYPTAGSKDPNPSNQHVFMNQPLSWWLAELNSGKIKYTPVSNNVNWAYVTASGDSYHMSVAVSNIIIPNKSQSIQKNVTANTTTIVFEAKRGMGRTDLFKY
jgi:hypothetical protein